MHATASAASAAEIEGAARAGDSVRLPVLLEQLSEEVTRTIEFLQQRAVSR
jgi:hypothetical protein